MKPNSLQLDLTSGRNPRLEIKKNPRSKLEKMIIYQFLNSNYLFKSNLKDLDREDYEDIRLLTQLTGRLSLKLL